MKAKGELVLCASCPAGYHHACAKLDIDAEAVKADSFIFECPVCIQNKIQLVSDCVPSFEKDPLRYVRHRTLGHDRHGRRYWFLVRRIWVEDSKKNCWYYSTPQQLESLLELLDLGFPLSREVTIIHNVLMNAYSAYTSVVLLFPMPNSVNTYIVYQHKRGS